MASAHNLLGLVNQLQNLELSFSKILMETAMKLSALTDANVFVLVETQEGRRFSGKRHLCDAYLDGSLAPNGNDVEFEINPAVCSLRQRRQQQRRRNSANHRHPYHQRSPKRRASAASGQSTPTTKRRKRDSSASWLPALLSPSATLNGAAGDEEIDDEAAAFLQVNDVVLDCEVDEVDDENDDVEEDVKLYAENASVVDATPSFPSTQLDEQTGLLTSPPPSMALIPFNGEAAPYHAPPSRAKTYTDADLEECRELNRSLMKSLPTTLLSKLDGLSQFHAGANIEPGSAEFRLLNSILYEFGIHARSFCPFDVSLPAAKKFLYLNLDSLIGAFPILAAVVTRGGKFPIGSRQITKLTYFREKTKKAFMKYVKSAKEFAGGGCSGGSGVGAGAGAEINGEVSPPFVQHRLELQEF